MVVFVNNLQQEICEALAAQNQTGYVQKAWKREEGGGGVACTLPLGKIFERAGVNVSTVYGDVSPTMRAPMRLPEDDRHLYFFASGISLVLHPISPYLPTVHMNYRYFEVLHEKKLIQSYFGGGSDLTPYYIFEEDIIHFHSSLKSACDEVHVEIYPKLKKECDSYFFLPHREEHRGVGGIFLLKSSDYDAKTWFDWASHCGSSFLPSYLPIIERRASMVYGQKQKKWQKHRRGRYVEFNLMYDLGTVFGLKSKGNIENILMSLPPEVSWSNQDIPDPGSPEAELIEIIKNPREWVY